MTLLPALGFTRQIDSKGWLQFVAPDTGEFFGVTESALHMPNECPIAIWAESTGEVDRLAKIAPACKPSRARVVDAGRMITAGGITSGMEMGFHLLRRAGYDEAFISEVARVMEYTAAYEVYRDDRLEARAAPGAAEAAVTH